MSVKKALVVDDSKLARITLKKKLELRAVSVDMAESAKEALQYLQSHSPDIIFMDHLMPEIDGFEATRRIKSNPSTAHIPVIMCTGKEHEGYLQEATAIGATNILAKPPETDALDAILAMDLAPQATEPAMAEPPILQPISPPTRIVAPYAMPEPMEADLVDMAEAGELIDDSFDADAAFGSEADALVDASADLMDTSELDALASLDSSGLDAAADTTLPDFVALNDEEALASLDEMVDAERLEELAQEQAEPAVAAPLEEFATPFAAAEDAFAAEPAQVELPSRSAEIAAEAATVAEPDDMALDLVALDRRIVTLVEHELATRQQALRETIIGDLTHTLRRQLDDLRDTFGGLLERQEERVAQLESSMSAVADADTMKQWLIQHLPPSIDVAALTDDITARVALAQMSNVLPSDDTVALRARMDELETDLAGLRGQSGAATTAVTPDIAALQQQWMPVMTRQLDALLQQRVSSIVSDVSDQVRLQMAYQMNQGEMSGARAQQTGPSLDAVITTQADIEVQISTLKKQLNDEWTSRLQVLMKQLKDQLQFATGAEPVDTGHLREQLRHDARDDIRQAMEALKLQLGQRVIEPVEVLDASRFEQMLESITSQFARTQASYEQKLKQTRLIALGAVAVSVVVSAAIAFFV